MSQSVIPIESMTYDSYADNKIRLYRYGKVRILASTWDGGISQDNKTLFTLDPGDRPAIDLVVNIPGWAQGARQRVIVSALGPVQIASYSGTYSDWFFFEVSWVVP